MRDLMILPQCLSLRIAQISKISRKVSAVRLFALCMLAWLGASLSVANAADDLTPQQMEFFETHIRPVLVTHCIKCHGDAKHEASLRLTKLEELLRGGESGPAIVPGKPDESLLLEALKYESFEMPPEHPLEPQVIANIEKWIADGAPWPKLAVLRPISTITEEDREWWCIQPIRDPQVPDVQDEGWCQNDIDRFIFAKLADAGLQPSAPAPAATLQRRLSFTLTGLPPQDVSPESSLAALLDQYLADPAYGENQARFWLDLVRYADSDGYNADHSRPEAAQYRDYVVRSFNADKPYDRFIFEQLAGDEIDPGNRDALLGTMYLRHWIYEWNQRDVEGQWAEILSDVTETTADVFLALSLKCARCHDHKFDPLLQKDYYEMLSFFAPLHPRAEMPLADVETRTKYYEQERIWEEATKEIRQQLHEIENPVLLQHSTREGVDKFVDEIKSMISKQVKERTPYEHQIASMAARQFDVHPDKLAEWLDEETEAKRQALRKQLAEFDHLKPQPLPTLKFLATDVSATAPPTMIPDRAEAEPVEPGFPDIINATPATIVAPPEALQTTGRRTALAKWLTDPANPLTARVIVNRIWAQHFGRGLVETVNDFGHLGTPPSHPELLDWLATRFMESGWSFKELHRLILSSATWQQRSDRPLTDELRKLDPANTLLWKMNSRRLSAEEIVDAMLSASEELGTQKRALYRPVRRNKPDPQLGLFDFPGRIRSEGQRHQTTSPSQALMLLNNEWSQGRAVALFNKLRQRSDDELIREVYHRLFYREVADEELFTAKEFLESYASITAPPEPPQILADMPTGQLGIDLKPEQKPTVQVRWFEELPQGDFAVEATVLLRSLYPDASVRTIATQWTGNQQHPGWSLGVTSTKSAFKPKNLILQLIGNDAEGKVTYEVVASNLRVELDTPYYLAVSVDLDETGEQGITFLLKDLSKPDAELQIAHVPHKVTSGLSSQRNLEIGGRSQSHLWDGLIHNVRLYDTALTTTQLQNGEAAPQLDLQFVNRTHPAQDVSAHQREVIIDIPGTTTTSPRDHARIALLHALMNSNEMIYID